MPLRREEEDYTADPKAVRNLEENINAGISLVFRNRPLTATEEYLFREDFRRKINAHSAKQPRQA